MAAESSLIVRVGADISDLIAGFDSANKQSRSFADTIGGVTSSLVAVTAAAVAAGAALTAALVTQGLKAVDTQADLARSLGGTYDALTTLRLAGDDTGVSFETLTQASAKLTQKIGEALNGSKEASKGFNMLGIDAYELANLDIDQRFELIATRVKELGLGAEQTGGALRTLGIRSVELTNLISDGGEAIRAARDDVAALGLSLSAIDVAQVQAANDTFDRLASIMQGVRQQFAVAFAPILQEVAARLLQAGRDANGWSGQITDAIEAIFMAAAKCADVVQGLRVVFAGLQVVFATVGQAFWMLVDDFVQGIAKMGDFVNGEVNHIINNLNLIPGVEINQLGKWTDIPFIQALHSIREEAALTREQTIANFEQISMTELPSASVEAFFGAVRDRAREAAMATVDAQASLTTMGELATQAEEADAERKARQIEAEKLHKQVLEDIEKTHLDNLDTIRYRSLTEQEEFLAMSYKDQVATVSKNLANMTAAASRESRSMFELNKIAGISNAIVSTYTGMTKALEWGFPLGPIFAGIIGASGFAQIAAIKSQSFGGGGAAPSLAGGTAAPPVTPVTGGTPDSGGGGSGSTLILQGINPDDIFTGRMVQGLAERLAEHQRDGGKVIFS